MKYYGRKPTDYEIVRCGMNVLRLSSTVTFMPIGLGFVQVVELEEWLAGQGGSRSAFQMLGLTSLLNLVATASAQHWWVNLQWGAESDDWVWRPAAACDTFMTENSNNIRKFMKAVKHATACIHNLHVQGVHWHQAWDGLCR
jgi:pyrimidine precursor biosynthesis enzyme